MSKFDILKFICSDLHEQYDVSGECYIKIKGKEVVDEASSGVFTFEYGMLLLVLCTLKMAENGKIDLNSSIDEYIESYKYANEVTVEQLLNGTSGIPDYKYTDSNVLPTQITRISELINDYDRDERNKSSATVYAFLIAIIEAAYGKKLYECINENVFLPLNIHAQCRDNDFSVEYEALKSIAGAIYGKALLNEASWQKVLTFDTDALGMACRNDNGFVRFTLDGDVMSAQICIDYQNDMLFIYASREENDCGAFIRNMLDNMEILGVYPNAPKLVPYGKYNAGRAVHIMPEVWQLNFVCDAKSALAYAYAQGKGYKSYVLEDGLRVIGIYIFHVKDSGGMYGMDAIIIDKKYQHKGYGKILMDFAVTMLKECGCKSVDLAVNKENHRAVKMYGRAGFKFKSEQPEYCIMEKNIQYD